MVGELVRGIPEALRAIGYAIGEGAEVGRVLRQGQADAEYEREERAAIMTDDAVNCPHPQ